jgi:hypothetical protein
VTLNLREPQTCLYYLKSIKKKILIFLGNDPTQTILTLSPNLGAMLNVDTCRKDVILNS